MFAWLKPSSGAAVSFAAVLIGSVSLTTLALVVPNEIQMPGTQPGELLNPLEGAVACEGCHGHYDTDVEPFHNWKGSMMAHASRDPVFWATMAVAEQTFDGSGDLCLRCHVPRGWLDGRSTPTDGSAMLAADADGVSCDLCHQMVNPDESEHPGVQNPPFEANDGGMPAEGWSGSGMYVITSGFDKLGPYAGVAAPHGTQKSLFHRTPEMCGTCHDVSNPLVGDLAHNNGAMSPLPMGSYDGTLGGPVADKAAFNNAPHAYGVAERTYSEYKASSWEGFRVADYPSLPAELQRGAVKDAYDAAVASNPGGNGDYLDGDPRYFTCQTCHMPPVSGQGCIIGSSPVRDDLPLHDLTGANYWTPDLLAHMDGLGQLVLGGGLTADDLSGLSDGKARVEAQLQRSAALEVLGNRVKVFNLTGHKLVSGYPEGRRMWLNVKWYDRNRVLLREDGAYDDLMVTHRGGATMVRTLVDLSGANTRIYQAKMGMTQEWADQLINDFGFSASLVLTYDRVTGLADKTLGDLAAEAPGTSYETFHFALNNTVVEDTRIPPYGFDYDEALERSALPIPEDQYGDPGPGGNYRYWDELDLSPPAGAVAAKIDLLYQPTSWEYIQFLELANDGSVTFLADEGENLYDGWVNTSMAEPFVMASAKWRKFPRLADPQDEAPTNQGPFPGRTAPLH